MNLPHGIRLTALGLVAAAAAGVGGCSGAGVLNALEPRWGTTLAGDVPYGAGPRQRLDVYSPRRASGQAPVVVFFYGGGWDSGRRQDYAFVGRALARRGYVTVIPDYRLYPEARWPAFLQDGAQAVAWARAHASSYGGDPGRLVLMGHSAGAYNAMMLGLDGRWLGEVGLKPGRDIRAVVGLSGPYDFLPLRSPRLKTIFGPEAQQAETQPIAYAGEGAPPLWLATSLSDRYVDPGNTSRLAAAVRARGGVAAVRVYPGLNHALTVGAIATPLRLLAPVLSEAGAFIDVHARPVERRPWR